MIAFLDTEFTDLVVWPRLLSVGLVAGAKTNLEFYAEVTDSDRIQTASRFASDAVLPQFGEVEHAACAYAALGGRLSTFLEGLTADLEADEIVEVAYSYDLDWELVERAIADSGTAQWTSTRRRLKPVNIFGITGFGPGKLAAEAYFKSQCGAPFSRHHALCDARALRMAYAASACGSNDESHLRSVHSGDHTNGRKFFDHHDSRSPGVATPPPTRTAAGRTPS